MIQYRLIYRFFFCCFPLSLLIQDVVFLKEKLPTTSLSSWKLVVVWLLWSCLTFCDPMDCSLPGSSVHGILQARILEWVAIPFSRGSSQPRDPACVLFITSGFFPPTPREKALRAYRRFKWPISVSGLREKNVKNWADFKPTKWREKKGLPWWSRS